MTKRKWSTIEEKSGALELVGRINS
jgi:hypothetical protein